MSTNPKLKLTEVKHFRAGDIEVFFLERGDVLIQKYDKNDYKVEEISIPKAIWAQLREQITKELNDG
tara:strand:+ start:387 stop:587 length:201 start_codon:yes stop_codon:yes gene_type:complete